MSTKINEIIAASIEVKSQILQDAQFSATIEKAIVLITEAFQRGTSVYFARNFLAVFTRIVKHYLLKPCIAILLI